MRALVPLVAIFACAPPEPTFENVQKLVFNVSCAHSSCHGNASDLRHKLSLKEGEAYANIVGATPTNTEAAARGWKRVVAGDAEKSFIMVKLRGPDNTDLLGLRMPRVAGALDPVLVNMVEEWIAAGALQNTNSTGGGGGGGKDTYPPGYE